MHRHRNGGPSCECAFRAFDTTVCIDLWGDDDACRTAARAAEATCRAYEALLSRTLPSSDIGRVNAAGGDWVAVDPRTLELVQAALGYCERSEGTFDVTIGPAIELWDFKNGIIPDADELAAASRHVGWRTVEVDEAACRIRLGDALAKLDLGGIAKGWIADRLRSDIMGPGSGVDAMVATLGGNVVVAGERPEGGPWRIGVRDPSDPARNIAVIPIASGSVVTSGTYERSFHRDGVLYHHVLDPATGWPVDTDLASATLVCERSIDAEGYSTTVLALGRERGAAFARERPEVAHACLVARDGSVSLL